MQVIHFHPRYENAIASGVKVSTVRWRHPGSDEAFVVGVTELLVESEPERRYAATVTSVESRHVRQLTDEDAYTDGFESRVELMAALHEHYPDLTEEDTVDVVRFRLLDGDISAG